MCYLLFYGHIVLSIDTILCNTVCRVLSYNNKYLPVGKCERFLFWNDSVCNNKYGVEGLAENYCMPGLRNNR